MAATRQREFGATFTFRSTSAQRQTERKRPQGQRKHVVHCMARAVLLGRYRPQLDATTSPVRLLREASLSLTRLFTIERPRYSSTRFTNPSHSSSLSENEITMQSSAATTTTFTHRRRTDAPGHYRYSNQGPAPTRVHVRSNVVPLVSKAVQGSNKDFYLDTLFNPVWMSGPHVFSFARDGKVMRPETYRAEPYPGYRASAASSSGRNISHAGASTGSALSGPLPSLSFSRAHVSKASGRMDKPWKNVAITEQDDVDFAAMVAEAEVRAKAEAKSRLMGLVYTWPPKPQPPACTECEVLARYRWGEVARTGPEVRAQVTGTQESAVPALSYGSSGESESESEVFRVVPGRRGAGQRKEVPLEMSVGFGRAPRKAPAPAQLIAGVEEGEGERGWTRFGAREAKVGGDGVSNPFMPEQWFEDELTVKLKAILRMPDV
ncbi:hypothetical protein HD554DRAFT_2176806 [Boletus coccyginus]|nr:hypothetical protein HD554DRAFT_2176806 [Boletus coccyginus]